MVRDEATISRSEQLISSKLVRKEYAVFFFIFLNGYANFILMLVAIVFSELAGAKLRIEQQKSTKFLCNFYSIMLK